MANSRTRPGCWRRSTASWWRSAITSSSKAARPRHRHVSHEQNSDQRENIRRHYGLASKIARVLSFLEFLAGTGGRLNGKNQGTGRPVYPTSALRAWMTHTEKEFGTAPAGGFITGASVEEFKKAPLNVNHYCNLQDQCAFILGNGSGTGFCSCGAGENSTRPQG